MEEVLDYDSRTTNGAKSAEEVVQRMRAIEERLGKSCPADFRGAYVDHIHAWELLIEVERDLRAFDADFNSNAALVESFLRGAMLDLGKPREMVAERNRIKANYQQATTKLRETYHRVERIAVGYGASLPKRAPYGANGVRRPRKPRGRPGVSHHVTSTTNAGSLEY
jgi:hypothetical protein